MNCYGSTVSRQLVAYLVFGATLNPDGLRRQRFVIGGDRKRSAADDCRDRSLKGWGQVSPVDQGGTYHRLDGVIAV